MPKEGCSKSSLEALMPGYTRQIESLLMKPSSRRSSHLPAISEASPPPDGSMSAEEEVEYLTRVVFLLCLDAPRPAWLPDHVSSAFRADFDNFPSSQTWDEHIETFRLLHRTHIDYQPEIVNLLVDVSEHNTHADAFLLIQTMGRPENVRRHSTARLKWRRRDGRWQVYHVWGVRAPFATFDNI